MPATVKRFEVGDNVVFAYNHNKKNIEIYGTIEDKLDKDDNQMDVYLTFKTLQIQNYTLPTNLWLRNIPNIPREILKYPEMFNYYIAQEVYAVAQEFGGTKRRCIVVDKIDMSMPFEIMRYSYKVQCIENDYLNQTAVVTYDCIDDIIDDNFITLSSDNIKPETISKKIATIKQDLLQFEFDYIHTYEELNSTIAFLEAVKSGEYVILGQSCKFKFPKLTDEVIDVRIANDGNDIIKAVIGSYEKQIADKYNKLLLMMKNLDVLTQAMPKKLC